MYTKRKTHVAKHIHFVSLFSLFLHNREHIYTSCPYSVFFYTIVKTYKLRVLILSFSTQSWKHIHFVSLFCLSLHNSENIYNSCPYSVFLYTIVKTYTFRVLILSFSTQSWLWWREDIHSIVRSSVIVTAKAFLFSLQRPFPKLCSARLGAYKICTDGLVHLRWNGRHVKFTAHFRPMQFIRICGTTTPLSPHLHDPSQKKRRFPLLWCGDLCDVLAEM
jgi:hypothetical protein